MVLFGVECVNSWQLQTVVEKTFVKVFLQGSFCAPATTESTSRALMCADFWIILSLQLGKFKH